MEGHLVSELSKSASRILVCLFLISPYLVFILYFRSWSFPSFNEIFSIICFSFLQALSSSITALVFGLFGAFGLIWFSYRYGRPKTKILETFVLLPNFLPPLFVVLATMKWLKPFPFGIVGITVVHSLINTGVVAVIFYHIINRRLGRMIELAWIEGARRRQVVFEAVIPFLLPDLWQIFFFLMIVSFNSFSVPLLTGKIGSVTYEVLIYQKILIENNFPQAFSLSALQILFTFSVVAFYRHRSFAARGNFDSNLSVLRWKPGFFLVIFPSLFILLGLSSGVYQGYVQLVKFTVLHENLFLYLAGTLSISVMVGFVCFFSLLVIAYGLPHEIFSRFLNSYIAPSGVLTAFAFLLLGDYQLVAPRQLVLAISIIFIPVLYRLRWSGLIASLHSQIDVARVLGAKWRLIYWQIIFPQSVKEAGFLAGLAAFWACGDFALSRIIFDHDYTLAMVIDGLMSTYRLDIATFLFWILLSLGATVFFCFRELGNVCSQKFNTSVRRF